jgi:cytoskeletal protein RodZ
MSVKIEIYNDNAADAVVEFGALALAMGFVRVGTVPASDLSSDKTTSEPAAEPVKEPAKRTTRKAADKPGPAAPADPAPETQAQDAADEKAESTKAVEAAAEKAGVEPGEVFDRNVMRNAGGDYARIYGMPAAQEDGPKIIGHAAFSKVPDDEIEKATRALRAAIETNPYGRTKVA